MKVDKVWLASYPEGIPEYIDENAYSSINEILEKSVRKFGDRPAFANMGSQITYNELDSHSKAFAAYLQQELGLTQGDRVAIMLPNLLQYPIAIFGILRAGLTVVNTNPMYTARELEHQLTDSGALAIIVLENFAHVVARVLPKTSLKKVIVTGIGDMLSFPKSFISNFVVRHVKKLVPSFDIENKIAFKTCLSTGKQRSLQAVNVTHEDIAFLQYTGGTTGVAKGAMLTHANLIANMQQSAGWLGTIMTEGREIVITALPLYHIFSLTANCFVFMRFGGLNYLITNPRDMPDFVKQLSKIPFTAITGVNTLFNGLLNTPGFKDIDFSPLRLTLGGGMAVQRSVAQQWKKTTSCTLVEAYGLTETSPAACMNPMNLPEFNGCIGLPISSTECSIQDDSGKLLAQGETGELCIRGPQVMKGYWQREEATAEAITQDKWLRTGDIALMNEAGFFKIVDRKKDMILVSGFNVYPNEIEDVVAMHDDVIEVAAIGVADDKCGETVKIFVVSKNKDLSKKDLRDFCRENLTGYKIPKLVEFLEELPKSNVGKILRRELRDRPDK